MRMAFTSLAKQLDDTIQDPILKNKVSKFTTWVENMNYAISHIADIQPEVKKYILPETISDIPFEAVELPYSDEVIAKIYSYYKMVQDSFTDNTLYNEFLTVSPFHDLDDQVRTQLLRSLRKFHSIHSSIVSSGNSTSMHTPNEAMLMEFYVQQHDIRNLLATSYVSRLKNVLINRGLSSAPYSDLEVTLETSSVNMLNIFYMLKRIKRAYQVLLTLMHKTTLPGDDLTVLFVTALAIADVEITNEEFSFNCLDLMFDTLAVKAWVINDTSAVNVLTGINGYLFNNLPQNTESFVHPLVHGSTISSEDIHIKATFIHKTVCKNLFEDRSSLLLLCCPLVTVQLENTIHRLLEYNSTLQAAIADTLSPADKYPAIIVDPLLTNVEFSYVSTGLTKLNTETHIRTNIYKSSTKQNQVHTLPSQCMRITIEDTHKIELPFFIGMNKFQLLTFLFPYNNKVRTYLASLYATPIMDQLKGYGETTSYFVKAESAPIQQLFKGFGCKIRAIAKGGQIVGNVRFKAGIPNIIDITPYFDNDPTVSNKDENLFWEIPVLPYFADDSASKRQRNSLNEFLTSLTLFNKKEK
jgi:hypothetical protein